MSTDSADYDIAIVGAGASGLMAAVSAGGHNAKIVLFERNDKCGRKLLITGGGKCNLTNAAPIEDFIVKFGHSGQFLRSAFHVFSNHDLMDFFESIGLKLVKDDSGRILPACMNSRLVLEALLNYLHQLNVEIVNNARVSVISRSEGVFKIQFFDPASEIIVKSVILATGGISYKATGSSGDGIAIAQKFGHNITALQPGMVPLKICESWIKDLQGISLNDAEVTALTLQGKKISKGRGEFIFTHFGVSGPVIIDMSEKIIKTCAAGGKVVLNVDLMPGCIKDDLDHDIVSALRDNGISNIKSVLKQYIPQRMAEVVLKINGIDLTKEANQITSRERAGIIKILKSMTLNVTGALDMDEAMITSGGVSLKEIDPRSMESRIVRGLYFAGEMIDISAPSGGYNLQAAFSTGYLAGKSALKNLGKA